MVKGAREQDITCIEPASNARRKGSAPLPAPSCSQPPCTRWAHHHSLSEGSNPNTKGAGLIMPDNGMTEAFERTSSAKSANGTPPTIERGKAGSALPCSSDVDLFGYGESVIDLSAEIPDGALDLRMSQQQLHGT